MIILKTKTIPFFEPLEKICIHCIFLSNNNKKKFCDNHTILWQKNNGFSDQWTKSDSIEAGKERKMKCEMKMKRNKEKLVKVEGFHLFRPYNNQQTQIDRKKIIHGSMIDYDDDDDDGVKVSNS